MWLKAEKISGQQSSYLDLIRGLAAQLVVVGHALSFIYPDSIFGTKFYIQNFSVLVFFILSGYVISLTTALKLRDPQYRLSDFFSDRLARILTPFIPAIVFVAGLDYLMKDSAAYIYKSAYTPLTFVANILQLQNYPIVTVFLRHGTGIPTFGSARPLWTIAIEWWIYLLFGYLAFAFVRKAEMSPGRWLMILFLSVVPVTFLVGPVHSVLTWLWVAGVIIAIYLRPLLAFWRPSQLVTGTLSCTVLTVVRLAFNSLEFYDLAFGLILGGAFLFSIELASRPGTFSIFLTSASGWTKRLGSFSYSLYLVHYTICLFIITKLPNLSGLTSFFFMFISSNIVALLLYALFQRHYRTVGIYCKPKLKIINRLLL